MNANIRALLNDSLNGTKDIANTIKELFEEFKCIPEECEFYDSCKERALEEVGYHDPE
jgi:hypothetical protein